MQNNELNEVTALVGDLSRAFEEFKAKNDKKYATLEQRFDAMDLAYARGGMRGGGASTTSAQAKEHREKFLAWARKGTDPEGLRGLEVQASLSTLEDPAGGFLVPIELEKEIERLAQDSVAMRRLARTVTATGDYKKPLSTGGAGGGWVTEKEDRDETDTPELHLFAPPFCELYALPEATQKLLDQSDFDVAAWLVEEINDVFISLEGEAFITGDGVGRPKGLIDDGLMVADASWEYGYTGYIAGGHASQLNNADKLIDLQHALKAVYRQNGAWLMNDTTWSVIRKFKDGEGNYLWRPGLLENAPDILLGKPVAIDDNMPDVGADAYPVAFGDFRRAYTIVDHKVGTRLLRDPYTKKGFVKFYVTKRVGGGISNYQAVKFLKIAES